MGSGLKIVRGERERERERERVIKIDTVSLIGRLVLVGY